MRSRHRRLACCLAAFASACTRTPPPAASPLPAPATTPCDALATPRIVEPVPGVVVALGYALSNTILIRTSVGNVIVDASTSPERGAAIKAALLARAPGRILALIYTHSHLDHVGGASAFVDETTPIWASAPFRDRFLEQYGLFQPIEALRGSRQYGLHVPTAQLPCTAIGPLPDLTAMTRSGARLPNHTFSGTQELTFGDTKLVLSEAHGETPDELMVWLPGKRTLLAGDNLYKAFPNLYTIRGTTPRPIDDWIESLDRMRALAPAVLIPSHTEPLVGPELVQRTLTTYRDGIQWVRDATVRGANSGMTADALAETVRLPDALAAEPYLQETYGQVSWSVRGIYSDNLGWFAGEPEKLYPVAKRDAARREVQLIGGPVKLLDAARAALAEDDARWAVHLLAKLKDSELAQGKAAATLRQLLTDALTRLAAATPNSNGRAYLAESALEQGGALTPLARAQLDDALIRDLPLSLFLRRLGTRLAAPEALSIHESLVLDFTDAHETWWLTVRHGVAEVTRGAQPLPGTPPPVARVALDSLAWKRLGLKQTSLPTVLAAGQIRVTAGSWLAFARFMRRFQVD